MIGLDADLVNDICELSIVDNSNLSGGFKRFMLEMKMQIDRWDLVVSHFVFHSSVRPLVLEWLKMDTYTYQDKWMIWGAELVFTTDIVEDEVFAIDKVNNDGLPDNRYICKGLLPSKDMQKYLNLKAFW